jgi:hypothetical protein
MDSLDLCVNHKGKDVVVKVNLETANMLLNGKILLKSFT